MFPIIGNIDVLTIISSQMTYYNHCKQFVLVFTMCPSFLYIGTLTGFLDTVDFIIVPYKSQSVDSDVIG